MCQVVPITARDYRDHFVATGKNKAAVNSAHFKAINQVRQQFQSLSPERKDVFLFDAFQFNHNLALQNQEAVAMWIFGRSQNKIPADISIRQFFKLINEAW